MSCYFKITLPFQQQKIINKIKNVSITVSTSNIFSEEEKLELKKYYDNEIKNETDINKIDKSFEEFYLEWISNDKEIEDKKIYYRNSFIEVLEDYLNNDRDRIISKSNEELFGKLLHYIREDKSYFLPIINPDDINNVYAVKPKLDNPRIIRQQGAFLIFGIEEMDFNKIFEELRKPISKISADWIIKGKDGVKEDRIIVDKRYKMKILKELDVLGVNMSTLFPEIDKISDWVKIKYQEKLKEI